MLDAATSSSRIAIQARPRRESRRRKFTNSTISTIASATQYHGLRFSGGERPRPGQLDRVDRRDALAPGGQRVVPWIVIASPLTATRPMISPKASVTIAM